MNRRSFLELLIGGVGALVLPTPRALVLPTPRRVRVYSFVPASYGSCFAPRWPINVKWPGRFPVQSGPMEVVSFYYDGAGRFSVIPTVDTG
jgi:hypothetical protein